MKRFWNFTKNDASPDVELQISGDIVDDEDAWLYDWFGSPCASPNAFKDELSQYAGQNISVRIDSYGGNVFAATGIYNALMEHKKAGAKVTTIGDSKVMSAATTIFMAGDERKMSPGCIFMMHNPLAGTYGYASDLRKAADVLDVVKDCMINAYQLATNLSRNKISTMMDDETYMSARTAVKNGFATEMLYSSQDDGDDDPQDSVMNFSFNRLAVQNAASASMKKFVEVVQKMANQSKSKEDDSEMEIKNLQDLKQNFPDLCNQLQTETLVNERKRMQDIDEIANTIDPALVAEAKYGEKPMTAEALALQALKADAKRGDDYIANRQQELKNAKTDKVDGVTDDKAEQHAIVDKIAAAANKKLGKGVVTNG